MSLKSIFQEGMKERKRRKSLGRVSTQFKEKEKTHAAQLTALGQKAWEAKSNLSAHPEQTEALGGLQKALDDLRAEGERLKGQKREGEAERKRESERLGSAQKGAEERKRETDGRLDAQRKVLQEAQAEIQRAAGRLAAIAGERGQLQARSASPAAAEADKTGIAAELERLAQEEAGLKAAVSAREESGKPVAAQIAALQEEAARLQKQVDDLRAEQKRVLAEADRKIAALGVEIKKNSDKVREAETRQNEEFMRLGEKLAAAASMDPNLAKEMSAVQGARAEMDGVQALISGLERQKDKAQVSAYKKMLAIIAGGVVLLLAIVAVLFVLLAPKKGAAPIGGPAGAARSMEELAQQIQKGAGGIKAESEKQQGGRIELAGEAAMKAVLPRVEGWDLRSPSYGQGKFGELETASLHGEYTAGGDAVHVDITDAGTASALLAGVKMLLRLNVHVDNADTFQQVSAINGIPVVESIDKHSQEASFGIIYKDRYLIEMRTRAARGLDLLNEFAAKLDLSKL
jgi:hypothetical protein